MSGFNNITFILLTFLQVLGKENGEIQTEFP
ncbi:hypothetical protein HCH_06380 [Hahella chejuensis KCTC 2396]|uniref:Uncharacterized protein n=1 Tax=Hahella chejuensis (strain KCTC 2396) TaxID=349521 RepID=Q2S8J9_HAHCH|nr:hypothetical protein HCH_06380 [Hahella chejuensis KCTC 2396]